MSNYTEKTIARLTAPTLSSVINSASKTMTVKWTKNSMATGYQIQYKTGNTVKTVTVKGAAVLSKVIKSLTKGKTYAVSIRAYRTVSGVNYYSAWSNAKNIKITK
jgi:methylthioribose-1-phosphate isomerase